MGSKNTPVCEKTLEILFSRCFLNSLPRGSVTFLAPTSREEARLGYDTKVTTDDFREVYLQFKAASYLPSLWCFRATLKQKQHRLMLCYPNHAAFYILPLFRSPTELEAAQRRSAHPKSFLRNFLAVAAKPGLPVDADRIDYHQPDNKGRLDDELARYRRRSRPGRWGEEIES